MYSEVKIRMKDEIPSEQIYLGTRFYKSHEKVFGEKDDAYLYSYLKADSNIIAPIIRNK